MSTQAPHMRPIGLLFLGVFGVGALGFWFATGFLERSYPAYHCEMAERGEPTAGEPQRLPEQFVVIPRGADAMPYLQAEGRAAPLRYDTQSGATQRWNSAPSDPVAFSIWIHDNDEFRVAYWDGTQGDAPLAEDRGQCQVGPPPNI